MRKYPSKQTMEYLRHLNEILDNYKDIDDIIDANKEMHKDVFEKIEALAFARACIMDHFKISADEEKQYIYEFRLQELQRQRSSSLQDNENCV